MKTIKKYVSAVVAAALAAIMVLSMSACGTEADPASEAEQTVKLMFDAMKKCDFDEMQKYSSGDAVDITEEGQLGLDMLKPIFENMSYVINSSTKTDDNNVTVNVTITTLDGEKIIEDAYTDLITAAMSNPSKYQDSDAVTDELLSIINSKAETTTDTVSNTIDLAVSKEDGSWKVSYTDEEAFSNAISGNLISAAEEFGN
jgi:hypothetical protein